MTDYLSVDDLGWGNGGQERSAQFRSFLNTVAQSGDVLILNGTSLYDIAAGEEFTMPAGVTIRGVEGCGFNFLETDNGENPIITMGNNCRIESVYFGYPLSPDTNFVGNTPNKGVDLHPVITVEMADNCAVVNNQFIGFIQSHVFIPTGTVEPKIAGNRFFGGNYIIRGTGLMTNPLIWNNFLERALQDSMKLGMTDPSIPSGWTGPIGNGVSANLRWNITKNGNREHWDATGGSKLFVVRDEVLWQEGQWAGKGSIMDMKHPIKRLFLPQGVSNDPANANGVWVGGEAPGFPPYGHFQTQIIDCYQRNGTWPFIVTSSISGRIKISLADFERICPRGVTITRLTSERNQGTSRELVKLNAGQGFSLIDCELRGDNASEGPYNNKYTDGEPLAPANWTPPEPNTSTGLVQSAALVGPPRAIEWSIVDTTTLLPAGGTPPPVPSNPKMPVARIDVTAREAA